MTAPHFNTGLTPAEQHHRAATRRDRIFLLLTENGPMKVADLVEATGEKIAFVREDIASLMNATPARVTSIRVGVPGKPHVRIAIYSAVAGEEVPQPGDVATCKTLTSYPPHHFRDPMVAALFGAR